MSTKLKTESKVRKNIAYLSQAFVEQHIEYENYVFVNSKWYQKIYANQVDDDSNTFKPEKVEGLVKIVSPTKTIYRKCKGAALPAHEIAMGYRSAHLLYEKPLSQEVDIQPTNAMCYLWNHCDPTIHIPFRMALVGGILSLLFGAISVIATFLC